MHAACWKIFQQIYALLATQHPLERDLNKLGEIFSCQRLEENGRGLSPDWEGDYSCPEQFWHDGWAWHEELEAAPEYDFPMRDPCNAHGFEELLTDPPRLATSKLMDPMKLELGGRHLFSTLPEELLLQTICHLPIASVHAVRLVSKEWPTCALSPSSGALDSSFRTSSIMSIYLHSSLWQCQRTPQPLTGSNSTFDSSIK